DYYCCSYTPRGTFVF
nr:immunoglobulin light chain junction region [Macaca mulatta]